MDKEKEKLLQTAYIECFKTLNKHEQDIILRFFIKTMIVTLIGQELIKLLKNLDKK